MSIKQETATEKLSEERGIIAGLFVKEKEYWMKKLSGELSWSYFPYDDQGKGDPGDAAATANFKIEGDVRIKLERLISGSIPKLHMVLTSAVIVLLYKYSGNEDIIIGAPIDKQKIDAEFTNTVLVLRNRVSGSMTFKEFLLQVRQTIIEAIENQNYPIDALVSQLNLTSSNNDSSLFDVAVLVENIHDKGYLRHVHPGMLFSFRRTEDGNRIEGTVDYKSRLYEDSTVKRIIAHLGRILETVLSNVDIPLSGVHVLSENEKKYLIDDFNHTETDYPRNKTIHELFEEQAAKTPDYTAAEYNDKKMSYRELSLEKDRVAKFLRLKGVTNGRIVGIMASRSFEVIVAILGILKAGGAYLPLDTEYPDSRKKFILEDSGATWVLTDRALPVYLNWKGERIDMARWNLETNEEVSGLEYRDPRPSDLAYVIYTSGSTGKPKGVMVEHRGVVNYVWWAAGNYVRDRNHASADFPLYTSISFDLTVTSIFTPLIMGGKIVVYGDEQETLIDRVVRENKVGVVKLTPTHLKLIRDNGKNKDDSHSHSHLHTFIVGGEELETQLARDIDAHFGERINIYNEYGPTEATVGCMIYRFNPRGNQGRAVPIGIPSANVRIYILDKQKEPVPIGVAGEIHISGDGVARGYLNRPELTQERFTPNGFEPGQRLYATGDLARFKADGNIEFQGRCDNQVKIRGHRIELGEIENKLVRHHAIKDAIVTVRKNETGDSYLCAYILTHSKLNLSDIREYISGELPDYMMPSYFVNLERFPLNPHGKIDRQALPDPMEASIEEHIPYVPPRDAMEKLMSEIWEKVLGKSTIGINENFFMMGGDSIKSIQIISRLNNAGYKLEMRDLFQYPVISELAPRVKKIVHIPDQNPVCGIIPMTPIQKWFFQNHSIDSHHFNQAVMFDSKDGFDADAIRAIFTKIQEHHDAFRITYKMENGEMIQINHGLNHPLSLEVIDLKNRDDSRRLLEARVNEIQRSVDLENGPLMKLALFHLDDGDRLLIVIHHLVVDGVSWRIVFEDLETLYQQYKKEEPLTLPLKTDSFKVWAEKLSDYSNSERFLREKTYWSELESMDIPFLRRDFAEEGNYNTDAQTLSFSLDEQETSRLLTRVNHAFGTEINDILLTALGGGIRKTWGHSFALISLEGHGREEIMEGIDISRTVGWFTSIFPLIIDISYEHDRGRQIKEVKEAIRNIPNKGTGYGVLKYLTGKENKEDIEFKLTPQFGFNYLGQFDTDIRQMSFGFAKESVGNSTSQQGNRDLDFNISGMIANNRLRISIKYNKKHYKPETVDILLKSIQAELKVIIAFCSSKEKVERTPSDFTYKGLSIETLDRLAEQYPGIDDIYTLTPMQEGMLFHYLMDKQSPAYFEQTSYRIKGELNRGLFEQAFNGIIERHDMLRTIFVHGEVHRPAQVVLKHRKKSIYDEDISHLGADEQESWIKKFKNNDKARGFELEEDILIRMAILKIDTDKYEIIWSFHHIIMDGWCISILVKEMLQTYYGLVQGTPVYLPPAAPYKNYIKWLEKQNKEEGIAYWQQYLESYESQATIPQNNPEKNKNKSKEYEPESHRFKLKRTWVKKFIGISNENNVTMSTIVQTLWGILLQKYNNTDDVVFGAIVSGRPANLENVEKIVGLFINAVPVRVKAEPGDTFLGLLKRMNAQMIQARSYEFAPLAEIQSRSVLKRELITSLFIFENYPVDREIEQAGREGQSSFSVQSVNVFEQTTYDLNIVVRFIEELVFNLKYNAVVFEDSIIQRVEKHLGRLAEQIAEKISEKPNGDIRLEDIEIITHEEKQQILFEFNNKKAIDYNIPTEWPKEKTIDRIFEEQVEKTPDYIAVIDSMISNEMSFLQLTYKELNKQSNRLAYELIQKGVEPDTIVGIKIERSIEMIIGILGILKSGGAYLPIDPDYPQERIDYMLKDSGAKLLFTGNNVVEGVIKLPSKSFCPAFFKKGRALSPRRAAEGMDLAYVLYTSGSTGRPKGVLIQHRSVLRLVNYPNYIEWKEGNRLLLTGNIVFDITIFEIWGPLLNGLRVYLVNQDVILNGNKLKSFLYQHRINILHLVPQILNQLGDEPDLFGHLDYFLVGGDRVGSEYVNMLRRKYQNLKILHMYGPTENTTFSTFHYVKREYETTIPIGKPLNHSSCYIIDKYQRLVPVGVAGELCVGGIGVARGYLNNPELTSEKFTGSRWPVAGGRVYHTGDLGRWLSNGNIEFLGRIDHQVKIRGFRIELGEIEHRLLGQPGIKEAVVSIRETKNQDKYLCAYIVSDTDCKISELPEALSKNLPNYMIPSFFVSMEQIPLTPNGKVDRKRLPEPELKAGKSYIGPEDEIEEKLVHIWGEILTQPYSIIGIDDDFFELGGHSLKATLMASKIHKEIGVKMELAWIIKQPTIRGIASLIKGIQSASETLNQENTDEELVEIKL
ncbi:MAG: amino acid adenylation domain-containing protein [Candidatus Omnitrophota bacterium]